MNKNLRWLLSGIVHTEIKSDIEVIGIALDSRKVKSGYLFIACKGANFNGFDFVNEAINKGATVIIYENDIEKAYFYANHYYISVPNLKSKIGILASKFFDYPALKMLIIGVTGTNGKTSITQYISTLLNNFGILCGVIGTMGSGINGKFTPTCNTTPDPVTLQELLYDFVIKNVKVVTLEVSSHGLSEARLKGINFDIGIFTNLTRDHLDYHGTMINYGKAKESFFTSYQIRNAIININDSFGIKLIKKFETKFKIYAISTNLKEYLINVPIIKATNIKFNNYKDGINAYVSTPWGTGMLHSSLIGEFNLNNLLMVLTTLCLIGIKFNDILYEISKLKTVQGRMQMYGGSDYNLPLIVVDYSHTPDALKKALVTLRKYCKGTLWCIFGCGGSRDLSKRALMGNIAEKFSDRTIITNDNPRSEDPEIIVQDILKGVSNINSFIVQYDRAIAIKYAINNAKVQDIILIAGKGHEQYQILGNKKIIFNDGNVILDIISKMKFIK